LGQATRQPPAIGSRAAPAISTPDEIIVLTMHEDPGTVRDSRVGGYLAKTAGPDELRGALNASARGTDNMVVEVPRQTLLGLSDGAAKVIHTLTAREREILTYSPPRRGRASDRMIRDFHVRASEQVESGPGSGHSFATGLLWVGARHCEQPRQRVLDRVDPYRMSATSSALASVSSQTSRRSTRSSSSLGRQATSFIASRWRGGARWTVSPSCDGGI
jgi:hypothetical protein